MRTVDLSYPPRSARLGWRVLSQVRRAWHVLCGILLLHFGVGAQALVAQSDRPAPPPGPNAYVPADAEFMRGMIHHHAQAVLMASWAATHGANHRLRVLCERIVVGQGDEIDLMRRWLRARGEPEPPLSQGPHLMPGHEGSIPLMPGMLTDAELAQLDSAVGETFDQLFLQGMIRHHQGALTMVKQLFSVPGGGQERDVFRFATGVAADQTVEIRLMQEMLDGLRQHRS